MGWSEVLSGVGGALAGAGATLASPWSNWGADRRRARDDARRSLVAAWRVGIEDFAATRSPNAQNLNQELTWLLAAPWFRTFRDYLTPDERATIERTDPIDPANLNHHYTTVTMGPVEHPKVTAMHGALTRLERAWRLV